MTVDEERAKQTFLEKKSTSNSVQQFEDRKNRNEYETRIAELDKLILTVYEDKVIGKIPENVCISLLEKYQAEKEKLVVELDEIKERSMTATQDERDVEEFIRRLKKYADVEELTREMALELIEFITIDENKKSGVKQPREIHIYYKLLDKPKSK